MRFLIIISMLFLVTACAQVTRSSGGSFTDPAFRGAAFTSIIVDARTDNLAERQAIENSAANTLETAGVKTGVSIDIVPPTRRTGETSRRRAIMNTGAASVLEIIPHEKQIVRDYVPGSHFNNYYNRRHWDRRYRDYDPFYDEPPLILEEPEGRYEATLYTLPNYDIVWTADFTTRGPTGMSFENVGANFARELVERMANDGIIPPLP